MHYFVALLAFAYLGHPLDPPSASAAEPMTLVQMDQVTAGARFQFNRYAAYARTITAGVGNVATATNSNTTLQLQGSGD